MLHNQISPYFKLGETVEMQWSCGHNGYIKADWLQKNKYPVSGAETAGSPEPSVAVSLLECVVSLIVWWSLCNPSNTVIVS